jgi:hypothetical protein
VTGQASQSWVEVAARRTSRPTGTPVGGVCGNGQSFSHRTTALLGWVNGRSRSAATSAVHFGRSAQRDRRSRSAAETAGLTSARTKRRCGPVRARSGHTKII